MKTFDIRTNLPFPPPFEDGQYCQDEQASSNVFFNNWFKDRGLWFGSDYYVERAEDDTFTVCFKSADEALWFRANHEAAR